jgi:NADH:ubiquinone oxidoreductase subunit F (NADH-binding)
MALAAHAVGAERGWIYLRHEYPAARVSLERAITEAREAGVLALDIAVCVGHGSYVCGEESALLRSIEGRRPEVMARPPYPTERGLFGQPTITNNVETLASVPWIVAHGGEAYRALGFSRSRGTKIVSLNSLFVRPGLYEVEFGLPLRRIVEEIGGGLRGGALKGVIVGGPLAGIVPPRLLDTPFAFEELAAIGAGVGHGGIIAFDEHTSIAALLRHVVAFGAYESCGKCTPCRVGARRLERLLAERAPDAEAAQIIAALRTASLCGHGTGLGEFAASALAHFGEELCP